MRRPVVMVAGATNDEFAPEVPKYRRLLGDAFRGFSGTVISGGTAQGIAGIVGDLAATHPAVHAVGYIPAALPPGASADSRYAEVRRTSGHGFSAAEPLQAWVDVIAAGIEPAAVAVLGVGGGEIAVLEYRLAVALGARVGLIEGSGVEVDEILASLPGAVVKLPAAAAAIAAFIEDGNALTG